MPDVRRLADRFRYFIHRLRLSLAVVQSRAYRIKIILERLPAITGLDTLARQVPPSG